MRRAALPVLLLLLAAIPARAADINGVWGITGPDGTPKCSGTAVLVFQDGIYARVLPKLGTLSGVRPFVMGSSSYRIDGDRIEVAPVHSLSAPEPGRSYLLRRGGAPELVREGEQSVRLKPCPELDPSQLIP